jgi:hypothetical protein
MQNKEHRLKVAETSFLASGMTWTRSRFGQFIDPGADENSADVIHIFRVSAAFSFS